MEKFIEIISHRSLLIALAILVVLVKAMTGAYHNNGFSIMTLGVGAVWGVTIYCILKFVVGFIKGYVTGKRS